MSTTPIDRRLVELRLLGTPAQAEELAFLEDWAQWKAQGGPQAYDHQRQAERQTQLRHDYELRRELSRKAK